MWGHFLWLPLIITLVFGHDPNLESQIDLTMPGAFSSKADDLICHSVQLNSSYHQYILEYVPKASKDVAHHMMIYGCKAPGSQAEMWKCGGMERQEAGVCGGGSAMSKRIVYAWALNAPRKKLPPGVGLRVGGDTDIQYMVLQLHYKQKFTENMVDRSGVQLHITTEKQPRQMGFYILGNWGYIPPATEAFHMESACPWTDNATIYPFGYRTHSHNLGRVTSAYRIRDSKWTEIGRMSPQQPEMFYDVTHPGIEISKGDVLAGRCTMRSLEREENTIIGTTNHDEMCNFYFMYHTDQSENLKDIYCFRDAQTFHWKDFLNPKDFPKEASSLYGVNLIEPSMEPKDQPFM